MYKEEEENQMTGELTGSSKMFECRYADLFVTREHCDLLESRSDAAQLQFGVACRFKGWLLGL